MKANFISQYYERVIAVVVMLLLVTAGLVLVIKVSGLKTQIKNAMANHKSKEKLNLGASEELAAAVESLSKPPSWKVSEHRLFIAPYMKENLQTHTLELWKIDLQAYQGMKLKWIQDNGFSTSGNVRDGDPDSDGFTNLEEFQAGTDPRDSKSKPDVALKLRVHEKIVQNPFPFTFTSINEVGSGRQFGLQRRDGKKEHYVKLNEVVPDPDSRGYKVVKFEEKSEDQVVKTIKVDGKPLVRKIDVSELTLQKEGEAPFVLIKGKPAVSEELFAKLYFVLEARYFEVGQGSTFDLQDSHYQVISVKKTDDGRPEVVIKKVGAEKPFPPIPVLRAEDLRPAQTPNQMDPGFPEGRPPGFPGTH